MLFDWLFSLWGLPTVFVTLYILSQWIRIINEYERGVVFRLGRMRPEVLGPGVNVLFFPPAVDRLIKVDMRTITLEVPPQDVMTKDNITVRVSAVVYYKVVDALRAVVSVENFGYATAQSAQTILLSVIGQFDLNTLLSNREGIGNQMEALIDAQTEPWGIKVLNVDIKDVEIPTDMKRVLARQAEAERDRNAKIIAAEGEFQAAEKLCQAAALMEEHPMALQMRYLQTVLELGSENTNTVIFPIPIDLLEGFKHLVGRMKP